MGWVTPLGHDIETVWRRMLTGDSGVASTTLFDARTFPSSFAAEVKDFSLEQFLKSDAPKHQGASRNAQFALASGVTAWEHAGLSRYVGLDPTRVGVYLGGGEGPIDFDPCAAAALAGCLGEDSEVTPLDTVRWAQTAQRVLDAICELEQDPNMAGGHLAVQFNAQGPNFNTLTACAASTQAIGEAMHVILRGDADVMITGGTHSMIHPLGVTGFNRLTALSTRNESPRTASRPFDRTRDGFVLGEGAAIVILEEPEHARHRGARILAEVVGYGSTADAFRITDIHEEGRGAIAAMQGALDSAGMTPEDIDYVSTHGTGTEENDKIETLAIRRVFGEYADRIAVNSIKSMIGHLIAAAGAVELITCVLAIRDGVIPPTINYTTPDPNCDLDCVPNKARKREVRAALSNSFGFGGQNNTLIVRSPEQA
ncbi:MAG: beta-ketoacyl-[acyl-carrier-protein] synthase family protein [Phycisphaerales bacterium]|nr:MAG: beta-ketoacyl-[acyl-carrier-protein] synthase family protein [Phycisphaerales bacterium]